MIAEGDKGRGRAREFGEYIPKRVQNTGNHTPGERTSGLHIGTDAGNAANKFPTIEEIIESVSMSRIGNAEKPQQTPAEKSIPTSEIPPRARKEVVRLKEATESLRRRAIAAQTLDDPVALTFDRAQTLHAIDAALDRTPTFSENAVKLFGAIARREVELDRVHGTIELGKMFGLTEMPTKAAVAELRNAGLAEVKSRSKGSSESGAVFLGAFIPDWREAEVYSVEEPQDHLLGSALKITTAEVIDTLQAQIKDLAARTSRDSVAEQCQYASALALLDAAQQNKMFESEGSSRENSIITGEQRVLAAIFEGIITGSLDSEQVYTPRKLQQQLQLQAKLDVNDTRLMQVIRNDIALLQIAGIAKYEPSVSGHVFNFHNITGEESITVLPVERKPLLEKQEFHYTDHFNPYPVERQGREIDFVIPHVTDPREVRMAVDDAFAEGIRNPQRIAEVFRVPEDTVRAIIQEKRSTARGNTAPTEFPLYDRKDPQSA